MGQLYLFRPLAYAPRILLRCLVLAVFAVDAPEVRAHEKPAKARQPDKTDWPVPNEPQQLFYIQRDPDINTVVYQLNLANGQIDRDNPVNIFWIRYNEDEQRKPLNYVQRTMAFGMSHKELENGDYALQLVSYKDLPLRLSYSKKKQKYVVYTQIQGAEAVLDRIYVRINGGSMFNPNIVYFELSGRHVSTGQTVSERISP